MITKLFALASVSALGGFVTVVCAAGCSSQDDKEGKVAPSPDAAYVTPADPNNGNKPPAPECKAKIEFEPAETKPVAPRSSTACTAPIISALADACIDDPNGTTCTNTRSSAANKTCADCIFGSKSDLQWKVVNLAPNEEPEAVYNQEGCVENVTGVKGCGHAYMTVLACFIDYCGTCDREGGMACLTGVAEGECKPYRINDEDCVKETEEKQNAIAGCFPATEDSKGIRALFTYMATLACGGGQGGGAAADGP